MRFRISALLSVTAILVLSLAFSQPEMIVEASTLIQDVPRLDGMNVYFTESAKEPSRFDRSNNGLSRFAGLLRLLGANLYTLEWRTGFPTDADLIVIAGPTDDLAPDQIARLWSYLNNNGRVLLLADPVVGTVKAFPANSGLFQLMWTDMGLRARADVVLTEASEDPPVTGEGTEEPDAVNLPQVTVSFTANSVSEEHAITANLTNELYFSVARSLEFDASLQGFEVTPLVFTDSSFYGEAQYADYLTNGTIGVNIGTDTARGPLALAAAFDNPETGSRLVIIGDREFALNGAGLQTSPANSPSFLYPDNVRFLLNSVTWLLDLESVDLSFATPGPTATLTITPSPTVSPTPTEASTPTPAA